MDELEYSSSRAMANTVEFCGVCASSACGVSLEHLNYKKHSMVGLLMISLLLHCE